MISKLIGMLGGALWPLAGAIGASLVLWGGVQTVRLKYAQAETREVKATVAIERINAAAAALQQSAEFRAEETRRVTLQQKKIDAAEKIIAAARADAAIADAAAGRLQQRVAVLIAAAREAASHPEAVRPGQAADDPAGVFADVLGRCVTRVRLLAAVADGRGAAGQLCQQSYDALND